METFFNKTWCGINDTLKVNGGFHLSKGKGWFCLHFAGQCFWFAKGAEAHDKLWGHWFDRL